jgi:phosphoserine phosphatase
MSEKEIILINISGDDRPGITRSVTEVLARHNANILDIGQAVIHETLSLGMLVEMSAEESSHAMKEMLFRVDEQGLSVKFSPIRGNEYQHWVQGKGKHRHIITLLARRISAEQIAGVTAIALEQELNIDKIERLSGRVSLEEEQDSAKACVEFFVSGEIRDKLAVRQQFLELAAKVGADIAFQEDNLFRRTRRLVCFDMDSTLIEAEVIDELAKAAGVGGQVSAITERAMRGELDFAESFAMRLALLKGLDESVLERVANSLRLTEGAEHLITTLRRYGFKTAIISGGFTYFGECLRKRLGFDYVYANELEVVDGQVTGRVVGRVVDGKRKAELLQEIAEREGISLQQVIAVGDGANDLPMLGKAGLGIAFRAKPIVKKEADHAISTLGLDGILYLMGYRDREL